MDPGKATVPGKDSCLALKPLLSLPPSPGQSQFARCTQAAIEGDQLWLPASYYEHPNYLWRDSYDENRRRNVIHVIGLADRSVRTVTLPIDGSEKSGTQMRYSGRLWFSSVILGSEHAYFLAAHNPASLYAIDRQTLEVKRVKLPLPEVIAMSPCTHGDTLYVSIFKKPVTADGSKGSNVVVAVEGGEITETVVSNMRKPPQTPLDNPVTLVDAINPEEKRLVLISNSLPGGELFFLSSHSQQAPVRSARGGSLTGMSDISAPKARA